MAKIKITKKYGRVECKFVTGLSDTGDRWSKMDAAIFYRDLLEANIPAKTDGFYTVHFDGDALNNSVIKGGQKILGKKWMPKWSVTSKKKGIAPVDVLKNEWEKMGSGSAGWTKKVSVRITGRAYNPRSRLTPPPMQNV